MFMEFPAPSVAAPHTPAERTRVPACDLSTCIPLPYIIPGASNEPAAAAGLLGTTRLNE